jgi:lipopolysaccharide transport system ATP-binding protein
LDRGQAIREGRPDDVLDYYNAIIAKREADYQIREVERVTGRQRETRSGDRRAEVDSIELLDAEGDVTRALSSNAATRLRVRFTVHMSMPTITVGFVIRDRLGNDIFGTNTHYLETPNPSLVSGAHYECTFEIDRLSLGTGHYSISVALHEAAHHLIRNYDWWDQALVFQVIPANEPLRIGVCNLPIDRSSITRYDG